MEVARGQISAANFVAANSRALILDAQGNINMCERDIRETNRLADETASYVIIGIHMYRHGLYIYIYVHHIDYPILFIVYRCIYGGALVLLDLRHFVGRRTRAKQAHTSK